MTLTPALAGLVSNQPPKDDDSYTLRYCRHLRVHLRPCTVPWSPHQPPPDTVGSCASLSTRRHGGQDSALQHEPLPALPCPLRSLSPRWQDATKVNLQGGPRQLAAVRQQGRGEELFVDYGAAYWAGRGAPGAVLAAENLDAALKRAVGDRGRRRRGAGTVGRGEVGVFDVDVNHRTRCN